MKRPELSPQLGSSFQAKCSNCHPNFIKPYPMKHELPVFALLIDADNVNKEAIVPIIEEVTRHGRIAVRRVYGSDRDRGRVLRYSAQTGAFEGLLPAGRYHLGGEVLVVLPVRASSADGS